MDNLKAKLSSQEVELNLKNRDAEALIGKIGYQTEIVSKKKETVDEEERKVDYFFSWFLGACASVVPNPMFDFERLANFHCLLTVGLNYKSCSPENDLVCVQR